MLNFRKLILVCLFIFLPIIDMINGYLVINKVISEGGSASPSQLGRVIAIILMLYYLSLTKTNSVKIIAFIILIASIECTSALIHQSVTGLITGITTSYKLVYFYILITILPLLVREKEHILFFVKIIELNLYLISISILIALVTGLGNSTYGWGLGTKGFFASGNSIGIYLGTMSLVYLFLMKKNLVGKIKRYTFLLIPLSLLVLSSKTALLMSCILLLYWISINKIKMILVPFLFVVTLIYQNEIIDLISKIFQVIISRYEGSNDFLFFIVSGRNDYVSNAFNVFLSQDPSLLRYIFGAGSFISYQDLYNSNINYHTLETDIFDVFFMYGVLGLIIYIYLFYYIYKNVRFEKILLLSFLLVFFHSLLAGHVIFNGMSVVSIATILSVAKHFNENR